MYFLLQLALIIPITVQALQILPLLPAGTQSTDESSDNNTDRSSNSKILVVYYSATGSTKAVAETIADTTGVDFLQVPHQARLNLG